MADPKRNARVKIERLPPVKVSLQPNNHPYMNGAWTPLHEEVNAEALTVIAGAIPTDLDGVYLRNTENPVHQPLGRFHPFDGDGMIHLIDFQDGRARYRNRFVRTRGFEAEQEAGGSLWGGLADPVSLAKRPGFGAHGALKDSSSTDIVVHAGRALSTFYQCGEGYRLDAETLDQLGLETWTPIDGISAHPKVDEATGELMFFNYSKHAPYLHYGVVDTAQPAGHLHRRADARAAAAARHGLHRALRDPQRPAGVLGRGAARARHPRRAPARGHALALRPRPAPRPRRGIRWFEAAPTYVLHWLNAYEDGDEMILDGYFQEEPDAAAARRTRRPGFEHMMAYPGRAELPAQAAPLALQPEGRDHRRGAPGRADHGIRHDQRALCRQEVPLWLFHGEPSRAGSCSPASSRTTS